MEIVEACKMNTYYYVKQSPGWSNFLKRLGWDYVFTKDRVGVAILKTPIGRVAKVQRPYILNEAVLEDIDHICKEKRVFMLKLEPNINQNDIVLKEAGYKLSSAPLSPPKSMYIDLKRDIRELWNNLSKSGKYGVRRGEKEGARAEFYSNPTKEQLTNYYKVLKQTQRRGNFVSHSYKELLALNEAFKDESFLSLVYDRKNRLAGGKYYVGYKNVVTYLNGGTSSEGLEGRSGYVLFWSAFDYFKNKGYEIFDLEGCYDPRYKTMTGGWKGFTEFKSKFGPEIVEYPGAYAKYYAKIYRFIFGYF